MRKAGDSIHRNDRDWGNTGNEGRNHSGSGVVPRGRQVPCGGCAAGSCGTVASSAMAFMGNQQGREVRKK